LLDSLQPVSSAAWNASGIDDAASTSQTTASMCTPGTRVSILGDLLTWADAPDSPCVFWLNGLAGTGKSTIARTFCDRLHARGLLGASFFISRDQANRRDASNIVRSIAHQLAFSWRPVSDALCAKLRETPLSVTRSLQQQITDFIITPVRKRQGNASSVIVIDALDESVTDYHGRPGGDLLLLLVRQLQLLDGRVKLCLTSRNEMPIQQMFLELSANSLTAMKLHDLDKAVVEADIATYLQHSFTIIRMTRLDLALSGWPPAEAVQELARLSGLLFIHAATSVRFITHRKHSPRERLDQLLGHRSSAGISPYSQLDGLYRQILEEAVRDSDGNEVSLCEKVHAVMAVIVLAQIPVDIDALTTLSGVGSDDARIAVGLLSSLLADNAGVVRVFHPSFSDFAIDATRCTNHQLCIVPTVDHGVIACRCLELMNKHLCHDMCNIQDPTVANTDVKDLDVALREHVSDALRYAACFWCNHIAASGPPGSLLLSALWNFYQEHLFHWIEILSLLGHVAPVEATLLKVIEWCEVSQRVAWRAPGGTDTYL
jgi:hypothetical protein